MKKKRKRKSQKKDRSKGKDEGDEIKDAEIISGGAGKVGNFAPTGDAKSKLKATFERILGK